MRTPWLIQVDPGQTIDMWLLDFGALGRHTGSLYVTCQQMLGHIIERQVGSNFTICGDSKRKKHIYSSKTNIIELVFLSDVIQDDMAGFIIQYSGKCFSSVDDYTNNHIFFDKMFYI